MIAFGANLPPKVSFITGIPDSGNRIEQIRHDDLNARPNVLRQQHYHCDLTIEGLKNVTKQLYLIIFNTYNAA